MAKTAAVFVPILLSTLTFAACGSRSTSQGAAPSPRAARPASVALAESEFKIEPKAVMVKTGTVTFQIKNRGSIEHNFVIKGAKVELDGIQPGQTRTVTILLTPGNYKMECTVPGHAEAGMVGMIKVHP